MHSLECYFGVYFPRCCATREINTKITLLWAHKQFATRVHTLFYMNNGAGNTVECWYNPAQHYIILHMIWQWQQEWLNHIHKRHLISHLHGWAMGCLLWGFQWKLTIVTKVICSLDVIVWIRDSPTLWCLCAFFSILSQFYVPSYVKKRKMDNYYLVFGIWMH